MNDYFLEYGASEIEQYDTLGAEPPDDEVALEAGLWQMFEAITPLHSDSELLVKVLGTLEASPVLRQLLPAGPVNATTLLSRLAEVPAPPFAPNDPSRT
jgi:hypothetical protein